MTSRKNEREPEFVHIRTPGSRVTNVYLGGVGPRTAVLFGGVGEDGLIDPVSYAGQFRGDSHLFVHYAPEHDEQVLLGRLEEELEGDCRFHVISMGFKVFQAFAQDRIDDPRFRIIGATCVNPVAGPEGLQPQQLRLVGLCRVACRIPGLRRSRILQRLWYGWDGGVPFKGAWRWIWPESPTDRAKAVQEGREAAYDLYRRAQREASVQMILTTSATLAERVFNEETAAADFVLGLILLMSDMILRARVNEWIITEQYPDRVRVEHIEGDAAEVGGHDSVLVFSRQYRAAYRNLE